jgi:hypothetical protein
MDRRKFLKGASIVVPGAIISDRRYGVPGSVEPKPVEIENKIFLAFSNVGVPIELWAELGEISTAIESITTSEEAQLAFSIDPSSYLSSIKWGGNEIISTEESAVVLSTLVAPEFQSAIKVGDYDRAYGVLLSRGLTRPFPRSSFQEKVNDLFQKNINAIRASVSRSEIDTDVDFRRFTNELLVSDGVRAADDDLFFIANLLKGPDIDAAVRCASCVVAVAIAATVVLYVSVGVSVTVAIMAAVYVSAAVQTAITISCHGALGPCPGGRSRTTLALIDSYAKLDADLFADSRRALRLAKLTGDQGFERRVVRELIDGEAMAISQAMTKTGLVSESISSENLSHALASYLAHCVGADFGPRHA